MTITLNGRTLPASASYPPYPKTERQAEFIALGDRMAEIAAEQAEAHDRENTFPHDTFAALKDSGYLALTVPEEYGGRGATPLEMMLAQPGIDQSYDDAVGITYDEMRADFEGALETIVEKFGSNSLTQAPC